MKRAGIWFWLSWKRYLHRVSFLVILLLLPVGAFFIRSMEKREGTEIRIAVCVEQDILSEEDGRQVMQQGQAPLEQELLSDLLSREGTGGMFRFYLCDSEDDVKEEVASRRAECGYVIASGLQEKLDASKYKRCIRVYSAPSTVTAELSSEVVFAALIRRYDRELFLQYVETGEAFAPISSQMQTAALREESSALYDAWMKDGGTFRFVYEQEHEGAEGYENGKRDEGSESYGNGKGDEGSESYENGKRDEEAGISGNGQENGVMLFPVRGIVSVYVFIIGIYGAAISLTDEKKGLYHMLPADSRIPCQIASILGPVALAAVSGLAALASGGCLAGVLRELLTMAGYGAAVTICAWMIRQICRRDTVVCCLIPFFLIGSLVFCPVIVDVGRYIPALDLAGRCFLPWYYLKMF